MNYYNLIFQPGDVSVEVVEGSTLKEAMNDAGIEFDFLCGGRGKCRVGLIKDRQRPLPGKKKCSNRTTQFATVT